MDEGEEAMTRSRSVALHGDEARMKARSNGDRHPRRGRYGRWGWR
jgi:hypothetical protein